MKQRITILLAALAVSSATAQVTIAPKSTSTNGLASLVYVNNATNGVYVAGTNWVVNQSFVTATVTNGLASLTYVDSATNSVLTTSKSYTDTSTNSVLTTSQSYTDTATNHGWHFVIPQTQVTTNCSWLNISLPTNALEHRVTFYTLQSTTNANVDELWCQINSDTSAQYAWNYWGQSSGSITISHATNSTYMFMSELNSSGVAGSSSFIQARIFPPLLSGKKVRHMTFGLLDNFAGSGTWIGQQINSGYFPTAALTNLLLFLKSGQFVSNFSYMVESLLP